MNLAMNLTSVEISFKNIGLHIPDFCRKECYYHVLNVEYDNSQKEAKICLVDIITDKKSVRQVILRGAFILLQLGNEFRVFNMKGEKIGVVSIYECDNIFNTNSGC